MVPIFEEQIARLERGYTLNAWLQLPRMEKALVIAVRRLDIAAKNLHTEAEIKNAKPKNKLR